MVKIYLIDILRQFFATCLKTSGNNLNIRKLLSQCKQVWTREGTLKHKLSHKLLF